MNHTLLCLTTIGLAGAGIFCSSASLPIQDSGFEAKEVRFSGGKVENSTDCAQKGFRSLKHSEGVIQMRSPYIPVKPNTFYRIKIWNRTTMTAGCAQFGIRQIRGSAASERSVCYDYFDVKSDSPEWRQYEQIFRTRPQTEKINLYFRMLGRNFGGSSYYDNVEIEECTPSRPLLVAAPYSAAATFVSGENLVIDRDSKLWRKINPDTERVHLTFDPRVSCSGINETVLREKTGDTFLWFMKLTVNRIQHDIQFCQ